MLMTTRLKTLRKQHQFTLKLVASTLKIPTSTYAGYEGGHRKPPYKIIRNLSELYKVSTDYLLGYDDEINITNHNIKMFLQKQYLHWDGIPLTKRELTIVHDLLELIVEQRRI